MTRVLRSAALMATGLVVSGVLLGLMSGCESEQESVAPATSVASSSPVQATPSPANSFTVSPSPAPTAAWQTYASPTWGYSIQYPPGWYDLPNFGAPDTEKYFSNQDVGAPLEMTPEGIWSTISARELTPGQVCAVTGLGPGAVIEQAELQVGSAAITRSVEDHTQAADAFYAAAAAAPFAGRCLEFTFISFSLDSLKSNLPLIDAMLESFQPPSG